MTLLPNVDGSPNYDVPILCPPIHTYSARWISVPITCNGSLAPAWTPKSATAFSPSVTGFTIATAFSSTATNSMQSTDTPAPSRRTSASHTTWTETVLNASHTTSCFTNSTLGLPRPTEIPYNFDWLSYLNRTVICPDGAAPNVTLKGVLVDAFCQPPIDADAPLIQSLSSVNTLLSTVSAPTATSSSRTSRPESSPPSRQVLDNAAISNNTATTRLGGFFLGPFRGHAIDLAIRRPQAGPWITEQGHQYAVNFGLGFDIALLSGPTKSKCPDCVCCPILVPYNVRSSTQILPKRSTLPSHRSSLRKIMTIS
jgi:hypothetical protein